MYLYLYSISIYILFFFLTQFTNSNLLHKVSLNQHLSYILEFNKFKGIIMVVPLLLSGLPPVGLFVIKVGLLVNIFQGCTIITFFLYFFVFLSNMLFYLQIFHNKNNYIGVIHIIKSGKFKLKTPNIYTADQYLSVWKIYTLISFSLLFYFLHTDVYLILSILISSCQQKFKIFFN